MAPRRSTAAKVIESITIPARQGRAAFVKKGQQIRVVNTHGTQVVDCWAFKADDMREFMSMEHCRVSLGHYRPKIGDVLVTNLRRPIMRFQEDSSPGVHDTMMAACDRYRYRLLGCEDYHDNCTDNMWRALVSLNLQPSETPCPLNLWQNTPVTVSGDIQQLPTVAKRGDHVLFKAEMDLVICLSCCPQDMVPINNMKPRSARFEVLSR